MKTGNTRLGLVDVVDIEVASMEPGHEDREYAFSSTATGTGPCLNGARS